MNAACLGSYYLSDAQCLHYKWCHETMINFSPKTFQNHISNPQTGDATYICQMHNASISNDAMRKFPENISKA